MRITYSNSSIEDITDVSVHADAVELIAVRTLEGFRMNGVDYFAPGNYITQQPGSGSTGSVANVLLSHRPSVGPKHDPYVYMQSWVQALSGSVNVSTSEVSVTDDQVRFKLTLRRPGPIGTYTFYAPRHDTTDASEVTLIAGQYQAVKLRRDPSNYDSITTGETVTIVVSDEVSASLVVTPANPDPTWRSTFLRFSHNAVQEDIDSVVFDLNTRQVDVDQYPIIINGIDKLMYGVNLYGTYTAVFSQDPGSIYGFWMTKDMQLPRDEYEASRSLTAYRSKTTHADGSVTILFDFEDNGQGYLQAGFLVKPDAIFAVRDTELLTDEAIAAFTATPEVTLAMSEIAEMETYSTTLRYQDEEAPVAASGDASNLIRVINSSIDADYEYMLQAGVDAGDALWYSRDYEGSLRIAALKGSIDVLLEPPAYQSLVSAHSAVQYTPINGSGETTNIAADYYLSMVSTITGMNSQDELVWDRTGVAVFATPLVSAAYPTTAIRRMLPELTLLEGLWFTSYLVIELRTTLTNVTVVSVYLRVPTDCHDSTTLQYLNGAMDETAAVLANVYEGNITVDHFSADPVDKLVAALASVGIGAVSGASAALLAVRDPISLAMAAAVGAGIGGVTAASGQASLSNLAIDAYKSIATVFDGHIHVPNTSTEAVRRSLPYAFLTQLKFMQGYEVFGPWFPGVHHNDTDSLNHAKATVAAVTVASIVATVGCVSSWGRYTSSFKRKTTKRIDAIFESRDLTVKQKLKALYSMREAKCWPIAIYGAVGTAIAAASGKAVTTTKSTVQSVLSAGSNNSVVTQINGHTDATVGVSADLINQQINASTAQIESVMEEVKQNQLRDARRYYM